MRACTRLLSLSGSVARSSKPLMNLGRKQRTELQVLLLGPKELFSMTKFAPLGGPDKILRSGLFHLV